ncbi:MAG: hypothetical protein HND54_09575 [Bacteroidetes bacterium]|nr:hypothetical protein [Bacteroidota bacterium]
MKKLFLFIIFLSCVKLYSQNKNLFNDSLDLQRSSIYGEFDTLKYYDLDEFQVYRQVISKAPFVRSGNIGLATHTFEANNFNTSYSIIEGYKHYLNSKEKLNFYNTKKPYTALTYYNGSKKEQYFSALHTQNITKTSNFSFQYDRITSEGFFSKQLTNHTKFNSTFNFQNWEKTYKSKAYYYINVLEAQENGGVFISDENKGESNTILLDINLRSAQNRIKAKGTGIINEIRLLGIKDSVKETSLIELGHELEWKMLGKNYKDDVVSSAAFYNNIYLDSAITVDSSSIYELSNKVYFNLFNAKFRVGIRNSKYRYFQNYIASQNFTSNFVNLNYQDSLYHNRFNISLEKGISGYFKNEIRFKLVDIYELNKNYALGLNLDYQKLNPHLLLNKSRTNHLYYNKSLSMTSQFEGKINLKEKRTKTSISANFQSFDNYLYFNQEGVSANYSSTINVLKFVGEKKFSLFKHWNLNNRVNFQSISNDSIIPLPSFYSYHSLYYQNYFFESKLKLQLGVDVFYIGKYNGYQYNPATIQFQLRDENKPLGNTTQLDLFLNLRIKKSAKIFIKMENVLQAPFDINSSRIQDYPIPGRVLKIGLFWRMLN